MCLKTTQLLFCLFLEIIFYKVHKMLFSQQLAVPPQETRSKEPQD